MEKMKITEFINYCKNININLTDFQINQLKIYASELLFHNQHINLTAIKTRESIYLKHFYDSLTIVKVININKINCLLDVGTGAGFPGLVLKIIFPHLNVCLLDSNNKKIKFLEILISKLDIKDIKLINIRAEKYFEKEKIQYELVVARAVAPLYILTEICMPLVKLNGHFLAMKGILENELNQAKDTIEILGGKITNQKKFNLPIDNGSRSLLLIKKIKDSDNKYPRSYNKILKTPLQKSEK